jgi:periplasmic copper chaperone A
MPRHLFMLFAILVLSATAAAQRYSAGHLVITDPWSRPTFEGMPVGVAYLRLTNNGALEDTLISARTPAAGRVEFHRTLIEGGMAKMRSSSSVVIPPNSTVVAEPGGLHLMLLDLKAPLVEGTSVPLVLTFKSAGEVTVQLRIGAR